MDTSNQNNTALVPQELLEQLSDEHRELVEAGVYTVHPGQQYPVLRWGVQAGRQHGSLAPGTGRPPGANDPAETGRNSWWKQTKEYKEMLQRAIPADLDKTRRGSLGWILEHGFTAIEGGDFLIEVHCPNCGEEFHAKAWKKPDGHLLVKMLEMVVGTAPQQKDVNITTDNLYRFLNEESDVSRLEVFATSPGEAERRKQVIEGEFHEILAEETED